MLQGGTLDPVIATELDAFDNRMVPHAAEPDWGVDKGFLRFVRKDAHLKAANAWINVMTSRINDIPTADMDKPLAGAITETGWTVEPYVRRHAHW